MMQRKLDLRHNDLAAVLNLIGDMADSGEVRSGYRIQACSVHRGQDGASHSKTIAIP